MSCSGTYATAWQFITFWCVDQMIRGTHEGAGPADIALQYAAGDFVNRGVQANNGMVLYNTTAGTNGEVTAVTAATITAAGVTWDNGDWFRIVLANGLELDTVEHYLNVAASDIHAALHSVASCDCGWEPWVTNSSDNIGFLAKLNIIDAASYHACQCGQPRFSDSQQARYLTWMSSQLEMIMTGRLELCTGHTGSDFPSMGWAEQSHTDFQAAQIIFNDMLRNS
jgi:hypothetical protein